MLFISVNLSNPRTIRSRLRIQRTNFFKVNTAMLCAGNLSKNVPFFLFVIFDGEFAA